ncbi:membrane protein [Streptomyces inusitatus]|uniref:Membrane protein n=1 Tax=Streptomyces inusitatus TaxID=68221 RepID=A0A918UQ73_9ACTN|nr:diiron oxygenase [Streptomyces inusitatus]GGZ26426.1 membrane protein [Streptomyces inusitatus]
MTPKTPDAVTGRPTLQDREEVADRLLRASQKHSFDPNRELDWDAPFEEGKWFWPPELISLYDTPLWRKMPEEQRHLIARTESASLASIGVWFEIVVMQLLLRHIYDKPVTSNHVRYALTEIGDECRHSMMFARFLAKSGVPVHPVSPLTHNLTRLFKSSSNTACSLVFTLLCEEVIDWMQRLAFADERVQTLVRGVTRIHVIEETRHVRYAKEELRRQMAGAGRLELRVTRAVTGELGRVFARSFINPLVYPDAGIDAREAVAQARASEHRREVLRKGAARVAGLLEEVGAFDTRGRRLWRNAGLL